MDPVRTVEFSDGAKLKLYHDDTCEDPRSWENTGTMVCFHRRYILGDQHNYREAEFNSWSELKERLIMDHDPLVILPLYLMDHSGISIYTTTNTLRACDPAGWDWGQVGFIFVSRENAMQAFSRKRVTQKFREFIEELLRQEVSTYNSYLTGDCYGFELVGSDGEEQDSCWGFIGATNIVDNIPARYHDEFRSEIGQS